MGYEKNMNFLVIAKSPKFEKNENKGLGSFKDEQDFQCFLILQKCDVLVNHHDTSLPSFSQGNKNGKK